MTPTRERRWWTSQEDSILKNVIKTQLDRDGKIQNWTDVAILLPGRTNKDCRKRWSKIQLDIRKGAWTHEEDERLQQAIQKLGFKWSQVATIVQSRNADQCSKRWHHALRPDFKHSPWTPEEDRKLLKAMEKHRNDWKQIGIQELPDRSTHEIRNRSLLLGRRNRNTGTVASVSAPQPSPADNDDSMVEDILDGDEDDADYDDDDDDNDVFGGGFEYDNSGSAKLHQHQGSSGNEPIQEEMKVDSEMKNNLIDMAHFHRMQAPFDTTESAIVSTFEPEWTGSLQHGGCHQQLPNPTSDNLSWLNPFEATISTASDSRYAWWTQSEMNEQYFHSAGPFDPELFDIPQSNGESSTRVAENPSADTSIQGSSSLGIGQKKGSVTLTLSRVNADVAHEVIGSVLKHSADLKIRYIVENS